MRLTGISVITPFYNSSRTLEKYLDGLHHQQYPKDLLEVILLDGGSTDNSKAIVDRFRGKLHIRYLPVGLKDNMEGRRLIGFKKAKFDIVCILDTDNYLVDSQALQKLILPMIENKDIVGSFTLHYHYDSNQTRFNRYVSLFGGHDPVSYYLNKTDRLKWTDKSWVRKDQVVRRNANYTLVRFNKWNFPTLGSNGSLIRKTFINLKKYNSNNFFHTDILFDLLGENKSTYAVVDTQIVHDTGDNLMYNIKKRMKYMSLHHLHLGQYRSHKVFNSGSIIDVFNLSKFILFTITLVVPISESVIGYFKFPDSAWFIHPFAVWVFLVGYSFTLLSKK